MIKRRWLKVPLLFSMLLLIPACGADDQTPTFTIAPTQPDETVQAAIPDLNETAEDSSPSKVITVMTYNILGGAGVDTVLPQDKQWNADHGYPGNRLNEVLTAIREADPDILGIQEAMGWNAGTPSVAQQVADELNMNYAIGVDIHPGAGLHHVVILTKYDITEVEDYGDALCSAGMRATILTPEGLHLQVFNAHLTAPTWETSNLPPDLRHLTAFEVNEQETQFLVSEAENHIDDQTIVMGDMNNYGTIYEYLSDAGFQTHSGYIDQIWVSPSLASNFYEAPLPQELVVGVSDHEPVIAKIELSTDDGTKNATTSDINEVPPTSGPSVTPPLVMPQALIGTWKSDSQYNSQNDIYYQTTTTVTNAGLQSLTEFWHYYAPTDGKFKYMEFLSDYDGNNVVQNPDGSYEITMTSIDQTCVVLTPYTLDLFNQDKRYGYDDWQLRISKDVSGNDPMFPSAGAQFTFLMKINGNMLSILVDGKETIYTR